MYTNHGNLATEPELTYTPSGKAVCSPRIAINTGYGDSKKTLFLSLTFWGKTAENLVAYCGKGSKIYIEGELIDDSWTDKEGRTREKFRVNVNKVDYLVCKGREGTNAPPPAQNHAQNTPAPPQQADSAQSGGVDDDQIPF